MTLPQAMLLGIVQGITEFLPISSDGHLAVAHMVMGLENELLFDVLLHLATLGAIIWYFRKKIRLLTWKQWGLLAVATIPAGIVGVIFGDQIEITVNMPVVVMAGFLVTAGLNFFSQYMLRVAPVGEKDGAQPTLKPLFLMGVAQTLALLPGVSRSGTTVATALGQNMSRENAFTWAFLLAIPAIAGAVGFQLLKVLLRGDDFPATLPTVAGMLVAFLTGLASLYLFNLMIKKATFWYFGVYCLLMATIIFFVAVV